MRVFARASASSRPRATPRRRRRSFRTLWRAGDTGQTGRRSARCASEKRRGRTLFLRGRRRLGRDVQVASEKLARGGFGLTLVALVGGEALDGGVPLDRLNHESPRASVCPARRPLPARCRALARAGSGWPPCSRVESRAAGRVSGSPRANGRGSPPPCASWNAEGGHHAGQAARRTARSSPTAHRSGRSDSSCWHLANVGLPKTNSLTTQVLSNTPCSSGLSSHGGGGA